VPIIQLVDVTRRTSSRHPEATEPPSIAEPPATTILKRNHHAIALRVAIIGQDRSPRSDTWMAIYGVMSRRIALQPINHSPSSSL
jgi:hypothetical protein